VLDGVTLVIPRERQIDPAPEDAGQETINCCFTALEASGCYTPVWQQSDGEPITQR
jgi:hypothetical protein